MPRGKEASVKRKTLVANRSQCSESLWRKELSFFRLVEIRDKDRGPRSTSPGAEGMDAGGGGEDGRGR